MNNQTEQLVLQYYTHFNSGDAKAFLELFTDDVIHEVSQGGSEKGKAAFAAFVQHMARCYKERAYNIVIMTNQDGSRAAAEFWLDGQYLETDGDLPPAKNQKYRLRVGAFFELRENKISRIANHYNINDWLSQVR